jgi:hypothetical protein
MWDVGLRISEINMRGDIGLLVGRAKVGFKGNPWWELDWSISGGISASGAPMQISEIVGAVNNLISIHSPLTFCIISQHPALQNLSLIYAFICCFFEKLIIS